MKNFFKKINKGQEDEQDSLNLDYGDFYTGKNDRREGDRRESDRRDADNRFDEHYDRREGDRREGDRREIDRPNADRRNEPATPGGGYYDVQRSNRSVYEEPDFGSDSPRYGDGARPTEAAESYVKPRETWQEPDAYGYRAAPVEPAPAPAPTPVFTPAPAPEYLYFTPSTYRDCREGIVKGLATGHVVVVRLRKLEAGDVLRLFDYMMGAVLALDGEMVRPAATTVVLVPKDVEFKESEIEPDEEEVKEKDEEEEEEEEMVGLRIW